MNFEILKELLEEILNENKSINTQLKSLKSEIEKPESMKDKILEDLNKLTIKEDFKEIKDFLYENISRVFKIIQTGLTNLENERDIFIRVATSWKKEIISLLKISIIGAIFYFIVLLFGRYYTPVINENLKFKNAYEYIYYTNEGSQDQLQKIILMFDDKKTKMKLQNKTLKLRKESSNPLVLSK